jgi:hypothetical protein
MKHKNPNDLPWSVRKYSFHDRCAAPLTKAEARAILWLVDYSDIPQNKKLDAAVRKLAARAYDILQSKN